MTTIQRVKTQGIIQTFYDDMMHTIKDLFRYTPTWFQKYSMELYEEYRQYQPIVDFFRFFIILSVVPLILFTLWSVGSIFISGVIFVMAWAAINSVGLTLTLPFVIIALFLTAFLTIITSTVWITMISGEYVYRTTLTFLRGHDHIRDIVVQRARRNAGERATTAATADQEEIPATTSTIHDDPTTTTINTALDI
ncbi:13739_t:CDS:2 [Funneliformis caledonium]|uniref:13739_t:CDS:1 n=1 Tax=Funneliformis caledonium TaxID=1117310 RepID=A0A9N8YPZ2_9GLOM|nr:13739_t:CDS:2 [Funneliformis caledonium]